MSLLRSDIPCELITCDEMAADDGYIFLDDYPPVRVCVYHLHLAKSVGIKTLDNTGDSYETAPV